MISTLTKYDMAKKLDNDKVPELWDLVEKVDCVLL